MYKNTVQPATAFLDGRRTSFLQSLHAMNVADRLRSLRLSLDGAPGVRAIATVMGTPDVPNTYGYYESKAFTKDKLPLDKARAIAEAFAQFGGKPEDVLQLAGLSADEIAHEPAAQFKPSPPIQIVQMAVALPSEDALATMMSGLLKGVGLEAEAAEHAGTLAQRLPDALAQAAAGLTTRSSARATTRVERAPSPSTRDRG